MNDPEARDRLAIAAVVQRYFDALDQKEYQFLDEVFMPDAILRYSLDESTGPPLRYPAMIERIRAFNTAFRFTQHLSGPPAIEIEGDDASARTNLRALHVQQRRDGGRSNWVVVGVYRDRLLRTAAGWRIVERVFRALHTEGTLHAADEVERYESPPWK